MTTDVSNEIDEMLDGLSRLAAVGVPPGEFCEQLLVQAMREAAAIRGAIWAGRDCIVERISVREGESADELHSIERLEQLDLAIRRGESQSSFAEQSRDGSSCRRFRVIAPYFVGPDALGGIELLLSLNADPSAQDRARRVAEAFAEILGDYYCRHQLAGYRRRDWHWESLSRFLNGIHRPSLRETAVAIANEGRWFVGCDRISVICNGKRTPKLSAVSGVDYIEPRSNLVARLEELAAAILKTDEAVWEIDPPTPRAPQIEQPLNSYLEESHSRAMIALPLNGRASSAAALESDSALHQHKSEPIGVLVLEWFTAPTIDEVVRERIHLVSQHAANALSVASATERLPFIACNRALAKIGWLASAQKLPAKLWAAGFLAVLAFALVVVPADFQIAADGVLQPVERREIFAPADAVVDSVLIEHGDYVKTGQPLLRLRSTQLELESARLRGEIQTAEKRLAAIRSARLEPNDDQNGLPFRRLQLSAEEEELKETLASLRRQEQLVSRERDELEVRSPLPGEVLTWDVARSLAARPVQRGQSLLSVGDVTGRWSLELSVPDEKIGYVMTAEEQARRDGAWLPVSVLLVGQPHIAYRGYVERIARRGHVDEKTGRPVVQVIARLDVPIANPRPGAGVVAKIDCGHRSLGFVWLYDAWNNIQRRLLF